MSLSTGSDSGLLEHPAGHMDQQLLFGVLAVHLRLLTESQLIDHWGSRRRSPLREVLLEANLLSDDACAEIDRFMSRVLSRHDGDARVALGQLAGADLRDALRVIDEDLALQTLAWLPPAPHFVQIAELEETTQYTPDQRSRYSLVRVQGQGGLGRVWLARDMVLQRSVALKEPRDPKELSPAAWRQFVVEAQVTGQLEHPNIVPVYELAGQHESRDVFYTMRYVRGQTLSAALAAYHKRREAGHQDPLELRTLLNAFVCVCQAIAYAHSRGVVHCDLKPGNVMLGSFGEVMVLDWGLAKVTAPTGTDADAPVCIAKELQKADPHEAKIRGSIPFMAPEQADGRTELIDSRSDIYGLGAMLFTILTRQPPHHATKAESTHALLRRILEQPTPRALEVLPTVPPALDAICAKAMAARSSARYPSAQDLARDVERWLADQEVSVYRDPLSTRALRWMRRHQSSSLSLGASLVIVAAIAIVSAVLIESARRREASALAQAQQALTAEHQAMLREESAKREATEWFQQTQQTVDTMLTGVGDVLHYFPGAKVVRARLLDEAARRYEELAARDADDPRLRVELARVYVRLGEVRLILGEHPAARTAYQTALDRFSRIVADDENDTLLDRAMCLTKLAGVQLEVGASEEARAALDEADRLLAPLASTGPIQIARADILLQRGQIDVRQHLGTAKNDFAAAEAIFSDLAKNSSAAAPDRARIISKLSLARSLLGQTLAGAGETTAAVAVLERARDAFRDLARLEPDYPPYLDGLAFTEINLGNALRTLGRDAEQARALEQGIADCSALADSLPGAPRFRENRADARINRAWLLHQQGDNAAARDMLDEAIQELNDLYQSPARIPRHLEGIAAAAVVLGQVLSDLDENEAAESNLQNAIAAYQRVLLHQEPNSARYARGLGAARRHLAALFHKLDRDEQSERECLLAIEMLNESLARAETPFARDELALAHEQLGDLLWQRERDEQAARHYELARKARAPLPSDPEYRFKLARLLSKCNDAGRRTDAIVIVGKLCDELPGVDRYRSLLGALHIEAGDEAAAVETLSRIENSTAPLNSPHHFLLAIAYTGRNEPGDTDRAAGARERGIKQMRDHAPGRYELQNLLKQAEDRST